MDIKKFQKSIFLIFMRNAWGIGNQDMILVFAGSSLQLRRYQKQMTGVRISIKNLYAVGELHPRGCTEQTGLQATVRLKLWCLLTELPRML